MEDSKQDLFEVKNKPNVNINAGKDTSKTNLKVLLEQRFEEFKEKYKKERKVITAHPGAEFKPENTPYYPDVNHPILSKHKFSTPTRNAGYQDTAQVPNMYRKPKEQTPPQPALVKTKTDSKAQVVVEVIQTSPGTEISYDQALFMSDNNKTDLNTEQSYPQDNPQGVDKTLMVNILPKDKEFELKISRENMHKGGFWVPNESRPYRPGDK